MAEEVHFGTVVEAYSKFRKLTGGASNQNTVRRFKLFLGQPEDMQFKEVVKHEEARHRITWLIGPNADVMWKIWQAQNQTEKSSRT